MALSLTSCGTVKTTITREHSRDSSTVTTYSDATVELKADTSASEKTIAPILNSDGTISTKPDTTVDSKGNKLIESIDHNRRHTENITPKKSVVIPNAIQHTTTAIRDKTVEKKEEVKQPGFFEKMRYYSTGVFIGLALAVIAGIVWYVRKRVPI